MAHDDDSPPAPNAPSVDDLDPRVRRALQVVYQIQGVVAAKVWAMPDRVAVGIRIGAGHGSADVLARVEASTAGLREPGEVWDFGLLDGDS